MKTTLHTDKSVQQITQGSWNRDTHVFVIEVLLRKLPCEGVPIFEVRLPYDR